MLRKTSRALFHQHHCSSMTMPLTMMTSLHHQPQSAQGSVGFVAFQATQGGPAPKVGKNDFNNCNPPLALPFNLFISPITPFCSHCLSPPLVCPVCTCVCICGPVFVCTLSLLLSLVSPFCIPTYPPLYSTPGYYHGPHTSFLYVTPTLLYMHTVCSCCTHSCLT